MGSNFDILILYFSVSKSVAAVNETLTAGDQDALLSALCASDLNVHSVTGDCIDGYQESLSAAVEESSKQGFLKIFFIYFE